MVKVTLFRNRQGKIVEFIGEGHSDYAPKGQDVVCAGVSALLQAALLGLTRYLRIEVDGRVEDGWLHCSLPDNLRASQRRGADAVLETLFIGLKEIEGENLDHIKVVEVPFQGGDG